MATHIDPATLQALMDGLPDVVYFVKDVAGRYTHANLTLVRRLGLARREDLLGRTAGELFPSALGQGYVGQDRRVLAGHGIDNQLELHLYPTRAPGWCLTSKRPLEAGGVVVGLIGLSRDLAMPSGRSPAYQRLRRVLDELQARFDQPLRMAELAQLAGLSLSQLERQFQRVFQLSPQQWLTRLRIEAAMNLLGGSQSIANVGQACGYGDQSAFARQFKVMVGMSPRDYRKAVSGRDPATSLSHGCGSS